jgi:hypothetical protein
MWRRIFLMLTMIFIIFIILVIPMLLSAFSLQIPAAASESLTIFFLGTSLIVFAAFLDGLKKH